MYSPLWHQFLSSQNVSSRRRHRPSPLTIRAISERWRNWRWNFQCSTLATLTRIFWICLRTVSCLEAHSMPLLRCWASTVFTLMTEKSHRTWQSACRCRVVSTSPRSLDDKVSPGVNNFFWRELQHMVRVLSAREPNFYLKHKLFSPSILHLPSLDYFLLSLDSFSAPNFLLRLPLRLIFAAGFEDNFRGLFLILFWIGSW